jgi:hypothetical protein
VKQGQKLSKSMSKRHSRTQSVPQHFTITKINWLTLFKEIIAVYSENHTEPIIQNVQLLTIKASSTYSCDSAENGEASGHVGRNSYNNADCN